jgi:hypothetical protein
LFMSMMLRQAGPDDLSVHSGAQTDIHVHRFTMNGLKVETAHDSVAAEWVYNDQYKKSTPECHGRTLVTYKYNCA